MIVPVVWVARFVVLCGVRKLVDVVLTSIIGIATDVVMLGAQEGGLLREYVTMVRFPEPFTLPSISIRVTLTAVDQRDRTGVGDRLPDAGRTWGKIFDSYTERSFEVETYDAASDGTSVRGSDPKGVLHAPWKHHPA